MSEELKIEHHIFINIVYRLDEVFIERNERKIDEICTKLYLYVFCFILFSPKEKLFLVLYIVSD